MTTPKAICLISDDRPTTTLEAPPRLHPGITQEVAPNESQRGPKATASEALIYDVLFVVLWRWCRFEKGSEPKGRWFKSSPRNHRTNPRDQRRFRGFRVSTI
jgi:hypothetical protein